MSERVDRRPAGAADALPVIAPGQTYGGVADSILAVPFHGGGMRLLALIGIAFSIVLVMLSAIGWVLFRGVGIWGINVPVAWGFAIINFVWWIGIGHAGTLISAILLLARQDWRTSINRFAEAMTLFAVAIAGLFPLLHLGRIQRFYWLFPYDNTFGLWPQWRSALVWDVFAVATYGLVSLLFWYLGLLPDLATMRDSARNGITRRLAGFFSLGWRGAASHWQAHQSLYLLLAALATPLVVSVHSIVSFDFATSLIPGWHSTVFPPYFVAGAIYSGFAMVLTIAIPLRSAFRFQHLITTAHFDNMAKVMLAAGWIVAYGYLMEGFIAWYSAEAPEIFMMRNRATGPYAPAFWAMIFCNVVVAQALWFRRVRTSALPLFIASILINVGMWLERYVIVVTSLHRDFMPSAWGMYFPTRWDWALYFGTIGFFALLFLLFLRVLPAISISEVRELLHGRHAHGTAVSTRGDREVPSPKATTSEAFRVRDLPEAELHGIMAEFDTPEALVDAARRCREAGYRRLDAFSPFPLQDLPEALGLRRSPIPIIVLIAFALGAGGAYFMQWYSAVVDYPLNVGGRPFHSWPSFVPITFELGVLLGSVSGLIGMLIHTRLPRLNHPVFNTPGFERATRDRFFLLVDRQDERFERQRTFRFLEKLDPVRVSEVES